MYIRGNSAAVARNLDAKIYGEYSCRAEGILIVINTLGPAFEVEGYRYLHTYPSFNYYLATYSDAL